MRAAGCYRAAFMAIQGARFGEALRIAKIPTDVHRGWRHMPLMFVESLLAIQPFECDVVGVEIVDGAKPLPEFTHPDRAFYIFGPEDGSIKKDVLNQCRYVVKVPTCACMNLAATVNVILYDRMAKRTREATPCQK